MRAILLGCSFVAVVLALFWVLDIRVNATSSMPPGLYRLAPGSLQRGDLVSLCLNKEPFTSMARKRGYLRAGFCPSGLQPLLKRIAGLPGDRLDVGPEGVAVDGRVQPGSRSLCLDRRGRPLPVSVSLEPGVIPEGFALLLSDGRPGGFDSRYFGLVPLASLDRVRPLFTFNTGD